MKNFLRNTLLAEAAFFFTLGLISVKLMLVAALLMALFSAGFWAWALSDEVEFENESQER